MNMNDITTAQTADLIAEWVQLEKRTFSLGYLAKLRVSLNDRKSAIAAELDRRCEGIYVGEDGFPYFGDFKFEGKNGTREPKHDAQWVGVSIPLAELHALLGWLLLKEAQG